MLPLEEDPNSLYFFCFLPCIVERLWWGWSLSLIRPPDAGASAGKQEFRPHGQAELASGVTKRPICFGQQMIRWAQGESARAKWC